MAGDPPVTTGEEGLTIPEDGKVSFYIMRGVQAAGRTRDQLEEALIAGAKRHIRDPSITVNLLKTPYAYVSISGSVQKPGEIPFRPGLTVVEALSSAEGLTPGAGKNALIHRKGADGKAQFHPVDLIKLYSGDISQDLALQPGDKIIVNDALIYVNGMVRSPGMLTLRVADTVGKAVAASGGVTDKADLQNAFIRRGDASIPVDLRQVVAGNGSGPELTVPLQAGDILNVPTLQSRVLVIGAVGSSGPVLISPKMNDKALDVLAQAGAVSSTSDLTKVVLIRNVEGNDPMKEELNLGPKGPVSDNVILQNGDVLYVFTKREKDRNQFLLTATVIGSLVNMLRTISP